MANTPVMYPYTVFPVIRIIENSVRKTENHITFRGIDDASKTQYVFNAFDSNKEKINKMDLKNQRVTVCSELHAYLDSQNALRYSFTVLSIRFVDGYEVAFDSKGPDIPKEPKKESKSADAFTVSPEITKTPQPKQEGCIGMDDLQRFLNG